MFHHDRSTQPTKTDIFCDAAIPVETPVYQQEKRKVTIKGEAEEVWAYVGISAFLISIRKGSDEPNIG